MSDRKFDRLRRDLERSSLGVDAAVPCCDYRDHTSWCACDQHETSEQHPFGRVGREQLDEDWRCESCGAEPTGLHHPGCPTIVGQEYIDGGPVPPYLEGL